MYQFVLFSSDEWQEVVDDFDPSTWHEGWTADPSELVWDDDYSEEA